MTYTIRHERTGIFIAPVLEKTIQYFPEFFL